MINIRATLVPLYKYNTKINGTPIEFYTTLSIHGEEVTLTIEEVHIEPPE